MPELPDIEVFSANLKKIFAGKKLLRVNVVQDKKLKDSKVQIKKTLEGLVLKDIYRSGKEFRFQFSNGVLMGMHLMLTGDIHVIEGENTYKSTIVEFHFERGKTFALTDRMKNANIKLNPEDKAGIDALELNYSKLSKILKRKTGIKNLLLDQDVIRGIGNGYSDEILWEAKISPYSVAEAIPTEKVKDLAKALKKVLTSSTKKIMKAYPGLISGEVKEFLKIHNKTKTHSPTGAPIMVDEKGLRKTYYTDEQVLYK